MRNKIIQIFENFLTTESTTLAPGYIIYIRAFVEGLKASKATSLNESEKHNLKNFFKNEVFNFMFFNDLLKHHQDTSSRWFQLGKELANHLGCHHYEVLFPQVTNIHAFEGIQRRYIKDIPFNELILGEHELTCWLSAYEYAKSNYGDFKHPYILESEPDITRYRKYTDAEERSFTILYSEKEEEIKKIQQQAPLLLEKPISAITLQALIFMVEAATFKRGAGSNYNKEEKKIAFGFYDYFIKFISLLSDEEQAALFSQVTLKEHSIELIENTLAVAGRGGCLYYVNSDLIHFVLDYIPNHKFSNPDIVSLIASGTSFKNKTIRPKAFSDRVSFTLVETTLSFISDYLKEINQLLVENSLTNLSNQTKLETFKNQYIHLAFHQSYPQQQLTSLANHLLIEINQWYLSLRPSGSAFHNSQKRLFENLMENCPDISHCTQKFEHLEKLKQHANEKLRDDFSNYAMELIKTYLHDYERRFQYTRFEINLSPQKRISVKKQEDVTEPSFWDAVFGQSIPAMQIHKSNAKQKNTIYRYARLRDIFEIFLLKQNIEPNQSLNAIIDFFNNTNIRLLKDASQILLEHSQPRTIIKRITP